MCTLAAIVSATYEIPPWVSTGFYVTAVNPSGDPYTTALAGELIP